MQPSKCRGLALDSASRVIGRASEPLPSQFKSKGFLVRFVASRNQG